MANSAKKSRMKSKSMQANRRKLSEGDAVEVPSPRPEVKGAASAETEVAKEVELLLLLPRQVAGNCCSRDKMEL